MESEKMELLSRTDERKSRKSAWNLMSSSRKKSRRLQH